MKKYFFSLVVIWYFIFTPIAVLAVSPADLVTLKKAGVGNEVITEVISSNAIDRAIISVDEIVAMKAAEMSDETILTIIRRANPAVSDLDAEDAKDRSLSRETKRKEIKLDFIKKQLDVSIDFLSKLITNPEIMKLVRDGKIASEDYAAIIKHLKQYARDEDSVDYREDRNRDIDIKKKVYGINERTKRPENYMSHVYIVKEKD